MSKEINWVAYRRQCLNFLRGEVNPRSCFDSAVLFDGAHVALGEVSLVLKYLNNAPTGIQGPQV